MIFRTRSNIFIIIIMFVLAVSILLVVGHIYEDDFFLSIIKPEVMVQAITVYVLSITAFLIAGQLEEMRRKNIKNERAIITHDNDKPVKISGFNILIPLWNQGKSGARNMITECITSNEEPPKEFQADHPKKRSQPSMNFPPNYKFTYSAELDQDLLNEDNEDIYVKIRISYYLDDEQKDKGEFLMAIKITGYNLNLTNTNDVKCTVHDVDFK